MDNVKSLPYKNSFSGLINKKEVEEEEKKEKDGGTHSYIEEKMKEEHIKNRAARQEMIRCLTGDVGLWRVGEGGMKTRSQANQVRAGLECRACYLIQVIAHARFTVLRHN
ncbi:hypothetical protein RRG08_006687 [Elysia crispata]|uniref:Uncharacterized protein n=1 Tax=Elysia crispata TaxID=231223 RepID=A0AAE0YXM6_9GAST|nr:hypothetical protein RRG08_006687 [Elysia crispata]